MRVPWNKGIKLKDNPKYSRMGAISATMLWELENGVTLCEPCHKNTPNYGYRAGSNPVDETVYSLTSNK